MVIHTRIEPMPSRKAPFSRHLHVQLAALCTRQGENGVEVLLITSSQGRWILPKGWPVPGCSDGKSALIEAWEEGGVKKAKVAAKSIGSFISTKLTSDFDEEPCLINVYEVTVKEMVDEFPEADRRDRIWVSPSRAADLVTEDGLKAILQTL